MFEKVLVQAIKNVGTTIAGIVNIIGTVSRAIENIINKIIDGINKLIRVINLIKPGEDIKQLSNVDFTPNSDQRVGGVQLPFGGQSVVPSVSSGAGTPVISSGTITAAPSGAGTVAAAESTTGERRVVAQMPTLQAAAVSGIGGIRGPGLSLDPDMVAPRVTINVNSASVIDQNGFTAAVVDAFNQVQARTGGGASRLVAL